MRKGIPLLLIAAGYALSAVAYSHLAPQVTPRFDYLVPWVDPGDIEAVPRAVAAFGIPTVALLVWLLLRGGATAAAERAGKRVLPGWLLSDRTGSAAVERFGPTFDVILAILVSSLLLFHAALLGTVLGWPQWTMRVFTAIVGAGIMVVGNIMPRTRPNWIAGLRTRRTLSDPDLWRRTHRYLGALLMATGIAVIVASLFSAPYALLIGMAGSLLSGLAASFLANCGSGTGHGGKRSALGVSVALVMGLAGTLGAQTADQAADPGFVEAPFEIMSGDLVLHGTLTSPDPAPAPHAVAVIVAGSGPTDRDGNGPLVQTDMYAQLAHGLGQRGIASVRYDKRGIGLAALTIDHTALTLDDYVDDVLAVARVLAAEAAYLHGPGDSDRAGARRWRRQLDRSLTAPQPHWF